jgi:hypothetical protein
MNQPAFVVFIDKKKEEVYEQLKEGKFENEQLYNFIQKDLYSSYYSY